MRGNHTIRKVELSTGAVTTLAGSAGQSGSTDGAVTTLAGSAGMPDSADGTGAAARFNRPVGVAVDGAGFLYVADAFNHTIRKIALANALVTTVVGIARQGGVKPGPLPGRLNSPRGIAVMPTGEIFTSSENALLKAH